MKFSEMKYERPDMDKVLAQCEEFAKKMAAAQSDEELVQLVCGAFGGEVSQLGNSAQSVPGAAGETVGLRHGDVEVANIILADGPAGLRLSRHYQTSRAGKIYP